MSKTISSTFGLISENAPKKTFKVEYQEDRGYIHMRNIIQAKDLNDLRRILIRDNPRFKGTFNIWNANMKLVGLLDYSPKNDLYTYLPMKGPISIVDPATGRLRRL